MPETHGPNLWMKKEVLLSMSTGPGLKEAEKRGLGVAPPVPLSRCTKLGWFLSVRCSHKISHLRKEMADAGGDRVSAKT